jgi:hypothetical protein
VLLVELSSGRSEAGDLLGLPKAYPTMDVVLESLDLMRPALAAETLLRVPGGFQLLPLGKAPVDTRTALSLLLALGDLVDYVLVDVPYSKRDAWTSLLPLSRRVLVTGEGSSTGLSRLRGELEELGEMDIDQRVMPVLTRCVEDPEIEGGFLALLEDLPLHLGNTLPRVSPEAPRKLACGEFHESGDPGEYALRLQQISLPLLRAQASSKVVRALSEPPFRPSSGPGIGRWGPGKVNASRETGPG